MRSLFDVYFMKRTKWYTHKKNYEKLLFLLTNNPELLLKKFYAKIRKSPFHKKINGIMFEFDFNYDSAMKEMYCGTYENETVVTMKKFLNRGDTFVDVGANIGYLSAIAMGLVGKNGCVHSFEPVPKYFHRLRNIATTNKEYRICINNAALGDRQGTAKISVTSIPNIGWNTMVSGFMSNETIKETIEVPVYRLDSYLREKAIDKISLIKIDTEGFEFPVLKGLSNYFENTNHRPVIICEIAPAACSVQGYTLAQVSEYMKKYGYHAFSLADYDVEIDITTIKNTTNVVFMRKIRVKEAI